MSEAAPSLCWDYFYTARWYEVKLGRSKGLFL